MKVKNDEKTIKFLLEIEYTFLLMNYMIPLLEGYKNNEDELKENMLKLETYLVKEFDRISNKYNQVNAYYYSQKHFYSSNRL